MVGHFLCVYFGKTSHYFLQTLAVHNMNIYTCVCVCVFLFGRCLCFGESSYYFIQTLAFIPHDADRYTRHVYLEAIFMFDNPCILHIRAA